MIIIFRFSNINDTFFPLKDMTIKFVSAIYDDWYYQTKHFIASKEQYIHSCLDKHQPKQDVFLSANNAIHITRFLQTDSENKRKISPK